MSSYCAAASLSGPHSWVLASLPPWCRHGPPGIQPTVFRGLLAFSLQPHFSALLQAHLSGCPSTCVLGPHGYPRLHDGANGLPQAPLHDESHRLPRLQLKTRGHAFCFSLPPLLTQSIGVCQFSLPSEPAPPSAPLTAAPWVTVTWALCWVSSPPLLPPSQSTLPTPAGVTL